MHGLPFASDSFGTLSILWVPCLRKGFGGCFAVGLVMEVSVSVTLTHFSNSTICLSHSMESWILDFGASNHLVGNPSIIHLLVILRHMLLVLVKLCLFHVYLCVGFQVWVVKSHVAAYKWVKCWIFKRDDPLNICHKVLGADVTSPSLVFSETLSCKMRIGSPSLINR